MTDDTAAWLDAVHEAIADHAKVNGEFGVNGGQPGLSDPVAFLDVLARHGLTLVSREMFTAMEAARPDVAELDVHAVVHLLGHTRRIGRLTNCAEIPGLVQLTGADGTVRWINPHKAVFEVEVVTEEEAGKRARPAGAAWDSTRGRVVGVGDDDPWRRDEGDDDDDGYGDEDRCP